VSRWGGGGKLARFTGEGHPGKGVDHLNVVLARKKEEGGETVTGSPKGKSKFEGGDQWGKRGEKLCTGGAQW